MAAQTTPGAVSIEISLRMVAMVKPPWLGGDAKWRRSFHSWRILRWWSVSRLAPSRRLLRGTPQIPARHGAVGLPARAELGQLPGRGQRALVERRGIAFADAIVVDRQHVRAAQAEDEQHLHRPPADAAHLDEALDDRLVGEILELGELGDIAVDGAAREIAQRQQLRAREAGGAQLLGAGAQDLLGGGAPGGAAAEPLRPAAT